MDALKRSLESAKNDTTKINILIQLIELEGDDNVWPVYNTQMLKLSETMIKNSNKAICRKGKKGMADAMNNLGYISNNKGEIPSALDYFSKSLIYQSELGDKAGEAEILGNMGVIYYNQKDIGKALDFYLRSLKLREELDDKQAIANSLNNIGNLCYDQKDIAKALYYSSRSLNLQEEIGDKQGASYSLNNLAGIFAAQGKIDKALDYYKKSMLIRKEIGDKQGVAASFYNMASVYLRKVGGANKPPFIKQARDYCDSALSLSIKLGFPESIRNSEKILSKIDSAEGNFVGAFEHYKNYIIYKDSLVNDENHKASMRSQIKYVYDKKEVIIKEQRDREREVARERNRVNKIRLWSVIGGLLLVAIFALYIWRSLVHNRKANKIITAQKEIMELKNHIIEEKQKEILDSINYAKRIQYTLLAHEDFLNENIREHFIFFNPKDIVSGDFYWATKRDDKFYLAVCDSTGHGVPGAFMSLLNIGFLSEAINEKGIEAPNEVLNYVRQRLIANISKEGQKDGFDGILLCIDKASSSVSYAAANNRPILIQNSKLMELETDRMPVGKGEKIQGFKLHTINCNPGDVLYLYTDGYPDQFGGPKGKKLMYKKFNDKLLTIYPLTFQEQKDILKIDFNAWRGELEQVDDVCVIGVRL